jgi:hypothetical protein
MPASSGLVAAAMESNSGTSLATGKPVKREGESVMTTLVSEMAGLKPRRDSDALNAKSRLMLPRVEPSESLTAKLLVTQQSDAEEPECGRSDLLIQGLVERLPKPNGIWAMDDRAKWLRTAASIFDLVYKVGEGERRQVSVAFVRQDAEPPA